MRGRPDLLLGGLDPRGSRGWAIRDTRAKRGDPGSVECDRPDLPAECDRGRGSRMRGPRSLLLRRGRRSDMDIDGNPDRAMRPPCRPTRCLGRKRMTGRRGPRLAWISCRRTIWTAHGPNISPGSLVARLRGNASKQPPAEARTPDREATSWMEVLVGRSALGRMRVQPSGPVHSVGTVRVLLDGGSVQRDRWSTTRAWRLHEPLRGQARPAHARNLEPARICRDTVI